MSYIPAGISKWRRRMVYERTPGIPRDRPTVPYAETTSNTCARSANASPREQSENVRSAKTLKYEILLGFIRFLLSMTQSKRIDRASHHISMRSKVDTYDGEKELAIPKDSCRRVCRMRYLPQIATRDSKGRFQCASSLSSSSSFVSSYTPRDFSSYTFVERTLIIASY